MFGKQRRIHVIDRLNAAYEKAPERHNLFSHILSGIVAFVIYTSILVLEVIWAVLLGTFKVWIVIPVSLILAYVDGLIIGAWHYKRLWEKK